MPSLWSVRGTAGASLLLAVFLLAACKPVTQPEFATLPTATPHPIVAAENPPSPPLGDVTFPNVPEVFTPFLSPYRPVPVGLGIIAFYLMLLLSLSFYARNHLGQKNFRLLHYVSYAVFLMVTVHGVLGGTDTGALWWLYAVSLVVVAVMTVLRVRGSRREQMRRQAPRPVLAR